MLVTALKVIQLLAIRYEREAIQLRQRRSPRHMASRLRQSNLIDNEERSVINVETYPNRTSMQKPPIIETYYIQTESLRARGSSIRVVAKTAMQYVNNSNSLSVSSVSIHCNESPLIGISRVCNSSRLRANPIRSCQTVCRNAFLR